VVDVLQEEVEFEFDGLVGAEPALPPGADVGLDAAGEVAFGGVGSDEDVGITDEDVTSGMTDEDVNRSEVDEAG